MWILVVVVSDRKIPRSRLYLIYEKKNHQVEYDDLRMTEEEFIQIVDKKEEIHQEPVQRRQFKLIQQVRPPTMIQEKRHAWHTLSRLKLSIDGWIQ